MLFSIFDIELRDKPKQGFAPRDIVIAQLDQNDPSIVEQIKYLEELQTPILVHNDLIRDPDVLGMPGRIPELLVRIFFLSRDTAAMFRIRYNFRKVADSTIYAKPLTVNLKTAMDK